MKLKKRQKLCLNCEGEVDLDVIVCPFCAADLSEEKREKVEDQSSRFSGNHLSASLYPAQPNERESPEEICAEEKEISEEPIYRTAGIVALFALGVQLFLFSLMLVIFSHEGVLLLKWSSRFWFLYLFASIPLLLFGYRAITNLK
jgi:hypothetical protein